MLAVIILVSKIKTQLSRDHLKWYGTPVINVNKCIFQSKYSHWFSGTVTYRVHICSSRSNPLRYAINNNFGRETIYKIFLDFITYFGQKYVTI